MIVFQLIDFDRHSNSLNKLRNKGEKSLSDEKNLFKASLVVQGRMTIGMRY